MFASLVWNLLLRNKLFIMLILSNMATQNNGAFKEIDQWVKTANIFIDHKLN